MIGGDAIFEYQQTGHYITARYNICWSTTLYDKSTKAYSSFYHTEYPIGQIGDFRNDLRNRTSYTYDDEWGTQITAKFHVRA